MTALGFSIIKIPMKNLIYFLFLVFVAPTFFGCATVAKGPSFSESKAVNSKPGFATLYVFREYAEPTAWGAEVQVDSKPVTTLNEKGFTWIYVKPGTKNIKAVWPGISAQKDSSISIDAVEGKTHFVELTGISKPMAGYPMILFKMGSGLNLIKPESAVKRLEACCKFQKPASTGAP